MKKNLKVLSAVIFFAIILTLSACTKNPNDKITVATLDGEKINKTEYLEMWENVKANYNITDEILSNEDYSEDLATLRNDVLDSLVSQKVIKIELENMGYYDFTQDEHDTIKSQTDDTLNNILASKQEEMFSELGADYNEKDLAQAKMKYLQIALEEAGFTEEYIEDYFKYEIALSNALLDLVNPTVADEEIVALFNDKVEADTTDFVDLAMYEYYARDGQTQIYYVPDGLRKVRHVLISYSDEMINDIRTLRSEGKDEEADKLVEEAQAEIYDKAFEVLGKIKTEEITFDEAIEEYNEDPGMTSNPEGYMMSLETTYLVQEFVDAGMELENIGDVSDLVGTDYGYHIIEYTSDIESGPIDLETVKDALTREIMAEKENEEWLALVEEWLAKHEIVYFYEELPESTQEPAIAE